MLFYRVTKTKTRFVSQGCVSEAPRKVKGVNIPAGWPQEGAITFKNYSMKYRENTPIVLDQLHLTINPREKLGIVGRTGSGETFTQENG